MQIDISIIIPCYNTENTVIETLISVKEQEHSNWEAIIVNDGSPDNLESLVLDFIKYNKRFKYFKKENGGLASARNFGISKANGEFIVPLDSDNKLNANFLIEALKIFREKKSIGVVYGNAYYFGSKNGIWKMGEFDSLKILNSNYIDACAVFRKQIFNIIEGYDSNLPFQGHEDWDLWLQILSTNFEIYYLDKILFHYRVSSESMIRSFTKEMDQKNADYIMAKHYKLYLKYYPKLFALYSSLKSELSKTYKQRFLRKIKNLI